MPTKKPRAKAPKPEVNKNLWLVKKEDRPDLQTLQINYKENGMIVSQYFYRGTGPAFYLSDDPKLAGTFHNQEISRMFIDGKFVTNKVCNLLHKAVLNTLNQRNIGEFSLIVSTYEFQHYDVRDVSGITNHDLEFTLNDKKYIDVIMSKLTDKEREFLEFKGVVL